MCEPKYDLTQILTDDATCGGGESSLSGPLGQIKPLKYLNTTNICQLRRKHLYNAEVSENNGDLWRPLHFLLSTSQIDHCLLSRQFLAAEENCASGF